MALKGNHREAYGRCGNSPSRETLRRPLPSEHHPWRPNRSIDQRRMNRMPREKATEHERDRADRGGNDVLGDVSKPTLHPEPAKYEMHQTCYG